MSLARTRTRRVAIFFASAGAVVALGGLAYAAVPGGTGSVTACYRAGDAARDGAALLVVDPDEGGQCKKGFATLELASDSSVEALRARVQTVEEQLDAASPAAGEWHYVGDPGEPEFNGLWTNYGQPYERASFRKEPGGVVRLRGLVDSSSWTNTIFTLPEGFRPAAREVHSGNVHERNARIDVLPDGQVTYVASRGFVNWISLSEITFAAAPPGSAE